jgi:hypothetical protein
MKQKHGKPQKKLKKKQIHNKHEKINQNTHQPIYSVLNLLVGPLKKIDIRPGRSCIGIFNDNKMLQTLRARMALKNLISPMIHRNSNNIEDRIQYKNNVVEYLDNISSHTLIKKRDHTFNLDDRIIFSRRMISISRYGLIYIAKDQGIGNIYKMVAKLLPSGGKEVLLNHELGYMPFINLPILYKIIHFDSNIIVKNKSLQLDLIINEIPDGDLKTWLKITHDESNYISCIFQIFLALCFLNSHGISHNNCHWGNIQYNTVTPGGYWHYILNGDPIYIQNCGELWTLWDYSGLKKVESGQNDINKNYSEFFVNDYIRIVTSFINKTSNGWCKDGLIQDKTSKLFYDILEKLIHSKNYHLPNIYSGLSQLNSRFMPDDISGEKILNNSPFCISI